MPCLRKMSYVPRFLLLLIATLSFHCTPAIRVHSARSAIASFDRYRTFAFDTAESAPNDYASSERSAEVCKRVREQATKLLEDKGYVQADGGKSDLVLRVAAGRREPAIRRPSHGVPGWLVEDEEDDFVEGAFVVDAFDTTTEELVWHGSARTAVDANRIDEERLQRAVMEVLASFPSRRSDAPR
jgi:hypothetical protein